MCLSIKCTTQAPQRPHFWIRFWSLCYLQQHQRISGLCLGLNGDMLCFVQVDRMLRAADTLQNGCVHT